MDRTELLVGLITGRVTPESTQGCCSICRKHREVRWYVSEHPVDTDMALCDACLPSIYQYTLLLWPALGKKKTPTRHRTTAVNTDSFRVYTETHI